MTPHRLVIVPWAGYEVDVRLNADDARVDGGRWLGKATENRKPVEIGEREMIGIIDGEGAFDVVIQRAGDMATEAA